MGERYTVPYFKSDIYTIYNQSDKDLINRPKGNEKNIIKMLQ